ncbi:hypothetical protein EVAR_84122_1 [Eumeta japonica]|uniref:Uncharacterized protein n=1 Tax=Eumeta variegata TaxID=151549 RepID=A0A4C1V091_EUMVA|nr:hypothetical protein EVAR_84122_1 [Eumeta japonica]
MCGFNGLCHRVTLCLRTALDALQVKPKRLQCETFSIASVVLLLCLRTALDARHAGANVFPSQQWRCCFFSSPFIHRPVSHSVLCDIFANYSGRVWRGGENCGPSCARGPPLIEVTCRVLKIADVTTEPSAAGVRPRE